MTLPVPMPETRWEVPALTANQATARSIRDVFPGAPYPYRRALRIYNRSGVILTFKTGGVERKIGGNDVVTLKSDTLGVLFYAYSLTPASDVVSGKIEVLEIGGLTEG